MFYTPKKEELERYQDCSWFQSRSDKEDYISKLSQAEIAISPHSDVNDLDLDLPFADRHIPVWGDEYLEVFDDADLHYEMDDQFGEKENYAYPSNESTPYINSKLEEDGFSDLNNINYSIRKTDSYDNMKVITSTSLSDIIPISYQEQVNNVNYNIQSFEKVKCEIKEEIEVDSTVSDSYTAESDDCDLIVGREEVVEVESQESEEKQTRDLPVEANSSHVTTQGTEKETVKTDIPELEFKSNILNEIEKEISLEKQQFKPVQTEGEKNDLKLNLSKNGFECPSLNVSTPDLCFMDLVNYINNVRYILKIIKLYVLIIKFSSIILIEINLFQESLPDSTVTSPTELFPQTQNFMPLKESSPNNGIVKSENIPHDESGGVSAEMQVTSSPVVSKTGNQCGKVTTINTENLRDSMSIAERIKVGSSRKRSARFTIENIQPSDDEEYDDVDDDYGEPKRMRHHSKSYNADSDVKFEADSYRERRDKNNEASRRSRQNKKDKERLMYQSLEEVERKNNDLRARADSLQKMVTCMRQLVLQVAQRRGSKT